MAVEHSADRLPLLEGGAQQIAELAAIQAVDDVPLASDSGEHILGRIIRGKLTARTNAEEAEDLGREQVFPRLRTIPLLPCGLGATVGKIIMRAAGTVVEPSLDSAAH